MRVAFYTLGCKVNLYETEVVINLFKKRGYELVDFNDEADVYVINTCTVTNTSDQKSRKMIRQAIKKNKDAIIVVMGCYSQLKVNETSNIEGVDIVLGTKDKAKVIDMVEEYNTNKNKLIAVTDLKEQTFDDMEIDSLESHTRAFVKIQDGCNNYCSYCIIPYARGNVRSKPKDKVIKEVRNLVNNGYIEVVLTGIHTGHYGSDLDNYDLSDLLFELNKIDGLKRIRISSIEITEINDKMLKALKEINIIANHLHIPLQSGSNKVLKEMNRKYDSQYFIDIINQIRSIRPNISITTDVIVGFPGETEDEYMETYNFIKKVNFSGLHVFPYSKREGTKAATMPNQINGSIKKERVNKLISLSKELEKEYMNKFLGKDIDVLFEENKDGYLIGHSSNYLKIKTISSEENIGQLIRCHIYKVEYPFCLGKLKNNKNV